MIEVKVRDNNIINLECQGKVLIRGKTANNIYFHTPLELLLCSLGLCVGGLLIKYCRENNVNINLFEFINIDYDGDYIITISLPDNINQDEIIGQIRSCSIASELRKTPKIMFVKNKKTTTELLKPTKCCGN